LTYDDRLAALRERKLAQTREKIARDGYMDEDDYGTVAPPAGWQWQFTPNHPNGCFYGAQGWGDNFRSLMEAYPLYVDPYDSLAGRTRMFLSRMRHRMGKAWHPDYPFPHLTAEQELYNIAPGIGADAHFGPDYRIGLELGWGGLLEKVRHFARQHGPEEAEFYRAEENVILGVQSWIRRHVEEIRRMLAEQHQPELRDSLREQRSTRPASGWRGSIPPREPSTATARATSSTKSCAPTTSATWPPGGWTTSGPSSCWPACC
jgi:formate C-acetyltransferase